MPKVFTESLLEEKSHLQDPIADAAAQRLFEVLEPKEVGTLMNWLNETTETCPEKASVIFSEYASAFELPLWADQTKMQAASRFYQKYEKIILVLLGTLSLPYCYAAAKGVKVLFLSQRLQKDAFKRLQETGVFVQKCNSYTTENQQEWKIRILKIRLLHALVRTYIRERGHWEKDWGLPINQEDMVGTNLSFSYLIIRGMRKLGIECSPEEASCFLHLWNVIGALIGVEESLLPQTMQEAFWLDTQIAKRHFAPSTEGKALTKALLEVFRGQSPSPLIADTLIGQMRFLLGEEIADMLDIPKSKLGMYFPLISFLGLPKLMSSMYFAKVD